MKSVHKSLLMVRSTYAAFGIFCTHRRFCKHSCAFRGRENFDLETHYCMRFVEWNAEQRKIPSYTSHFCFINNLNTSCRVFESFFKVSVILLLHNMSNSTLPFLQSRAKIKSEPSVFMCQVLTHKALKKSRTQAIYEMRVELKQL